MTTDNPMQNPVLVALDELDPHPDNPRIGDVGAIMRSLEANGQYRPIVANRRTNRILAGNHTYKAAKRLGWAEIAVAWVDVDEVQEKRIVLVDNRSADVASYDDHALTELLQAVASEATLFGTGYSDDDLDKMLRKMADPEAPDEFPDVDLGTTHECPQCGYQWS